VVSILVLSDRKRLIDLFSRPDLLAGSRVRIAGSIGDALEALTLWKPRYIFIQDRIGEVSGEVIAHRLGAGEKGKKQRIILIGDPAEMVVSGPNSPWIVLDSSVSDSELMAAVREVVLPSGRRGKQRSAAGNAKVAAATTDPMPAAPLVADGVDDVVQLRGKTVASVGGTAGTGPECAGIGSPGVSSGFQAKLEQALEEASVPETAGTNIPGREAAVFPGRETARPRFSLKEGPVPARIPAFRFRPRVWWGVALGACGLAALLLLPLLPRTEKPSVPAGAGKRTPAAPGEAVRPSSPVPRRVLALPSTVTGQPDPGYGKAHPGWERYLNPSVEFRVFREKGALRALQVLGRGGRGVSATLFESTLKEIAGSPEYLVETRDRKGSYLVEKGRLKNGVGIIIYRKEPDRLVRAFVVEFG